MWELLARWVTPDHAELWRFASYVFHSLIATSWRHGRVFLAGDAAHMTPPFMAQGMVQGLRDVLNLTWKLDLVLHGADPTVLDSYQTERRPHVRATSEAAKALGHVICELDTDRARQRDERMLAEFGDPPKVRLRQNLIPGLAGGLVNLTTSAAGQIAPQPTVHTAAGPQRLDDVNGPGFRLITDHHLAADLLANATLRGALEQLDACVIAVHANAALDDMPAAPDGRVVAVSDPSGILAEWFRTHGAAAVLVRPDHYVYGTADDADSVERLCVQAAADCGFTPPASAVPADLTGGGSRPETT